MNDENLAVSDNSEENTNEPQTDNQEQSNLLNIKVDEETSAEGQETEVMPHLQAEEAEEEPIDWGDRPDWIPQQFWSDSDGPDVEGVFKAYNEIRTKMSQGLHKAPKDGEYAMDVMTEAGVPEDDEMLQGYLDVAKKHGISQDAFNEIAQMYMQGMTQMTQAAETTRQEEMAKLGKGADKIIDETERWLTKLGRSGVLNNNEVEALADASSNGHFINAINKIRQSYNESPIPTLDVQEGAAYTRSDLDSMVADPRYGKDMAYTKQVEREFMKAFGEA